VCLARRFTDNIVADTSQVALICQCSKCTRGTPHGAESVPFVDYSTNHCGYMVRTIGLCRQAHSLEKFSVSRVVSQIIEKRIDLDVGQSCVSLFVATIQPFKRFAGLSPKRIHLSDLISRISVMQRCSCGRRSAIRSPESFHSSPRAYQGRRNNMNRRSDCEARPAINMISGAGSTTNDLASLANHFRPLRRRCGTRVAHVAAA
jgi:hypothetical protein